MLLITAAIQIIPMYNEKVRVWVQSNPWAFVVAIVVMVLTLCFLGCSKSTARAVPYNYLLLFTFTLSTAYLVMTATSYYDPMSVIFAVLLTAAMVITLTIYAMSTSTDVDSVTGGFLIVVVTLLLGIIANIYYI